MNLLYLITSISCSRFMFWPGTNISEFYLRTFYLYVIIVSWWQHIPRLKLVVPGYVHKLEKIWHGLHFKGVGATLCLEEQLPLITEDSKVTDAIVSCRLTAKDNFATCSHSFQELQAARLLNVSNNRYWDVGENSTWLRTIVTAWYRYLCHGVNC